MEDDASQWELALHISQESITHGRRSNCEWCPVALELKRYFPDTATRGHMINVGSESASVEGWDRTDPSSYIDFRLADDAVHFIEDFDLAEDMHPQTVHLYIQTDN